MNIDIAKIEEAVRQIAAENPNHVYQPVGNYDACYYVKGGGCIVGRAILKVYPELKEKLTQVDVCGMLSVACLLCRLSDTDVSADKAEWLRLVQNAQDNRNTWAFCVAYADADLSKIKS
jgi:hypothetical protein